MRRLPIVLASVVGVVAGGYTLVYLARWEWNRALIAGMFFVATEVLVATGLILSRLRRLEDRLDGLTVRAPSADTIEQLTTTLRAEEPAAVHHFAWLREARDSANVFLPVLLGIGVVASALSWLVEHLVRLVAAPVTTRRLALRLAPITVPTGGLLAPPPHAVRDRSRPRLLAGLLIATVALLVGAGAVFGLDYLADRIQTRPDALLAGSETVLDVELRGELAAHDPDRVFGHLWIACTGPGVFKHRALPPAATGPVVDGSLRVVVPADVGRHGLDRLVGCLNDTTLDGVQASVIETEIRQR